MRPTSESGQMDALEKIFSNPKKNWVNLLLIGINGILFLLAELAGSTLDNGWAIRWGASYTPLIQAGEYWRLFTSMFYHFGFQHLFNNMLLLLFLGDALESQLGHLKYLFLYLAGGLGGNLLSLYLDIRSGDPVVSAGASGCVFAVVGGLLYVLVRRKGRLEEMTVFLLLHQGRDGGAGGEGGSDPGQPDHSYPPSAGHGQYPHRSGDRTSGLRGGGKGPGAPAPGKWNSV